MPLEHAPSARRDPGARERLWAILRAEAPSAVARMEARFAAREFVAKMRQSLVKYDPVSHRSWGEVHHIMKTDMAHYLFIQRRFPRGDSVRKRQGGKKKGRK